MNRRTVYTKKWPGRKRPSSIAMNCHVRDGLLCYYDTIRVHGIEGEVIEDGDDGFKFRSDGFEPGIWEFKVLTIEDFRREIYKIVGNGDIIAQTVHTTDDLQQWYRTKFGAEAGIFYPLDD